MIIYTTLVGDLFHYGHVNMLKLCKEIGTYLIVGVIDDKDVESYKRTPIMSLEERTKVIEACKYVDQVIAAYGYISISIVFYINRYGKIKYLKRIHNKSFLDLRSLLTPLCFK